MHITIEVTVRKSKHEYPPSIAELDIDCPIDMALDPDWGGMVRLLIQQAHDSYLENVAGEGDES